MFATSSTVAGRWMIELGRFAFTEGGGSFLYGQAGVIGALLQHRLEGPGQLCVGELWPAV